MAIRTALDRVRGEIRFDHPPPDRLVVTVANVVSRGIQPDHVTFVEVNETIGHGQQGVDVGREKVLLEPDSQHQRAAGPGADDDARLCRTDHGDRERAVQTLDRPAHRGEQVIAVLHQAVNQVHHDLGIGIG